MASDNYRILAKAIIYLCGATLSAVTPTLTPAVKSRESR
jgi:hypothetical protein